MATTITKSVLFVDDDRILRHLILKKLDGYAQQFRIVLAGDGAEAMDLLRRESISLVITDLQMPGTDGFALMAHMSEQYPDIPVIVLTAFGTPQAKKWVLDRGAIGFIEKPFVVEDLGQMILDVLKRETEGGTLQTIPTPIFLQLVEMEQKTCTIRVNNRETKKTGVLFFSAGELMDARFLNMYGETAAYEILSWDRVSLSIQDTCVIQEKHIEGTLQAVMFEAMRRKDETRSGGTGISDMDEDPAGPDAPPVEAAPDSPYRNALDAIRAERGGLVAINTGDDWNGLLTGARQLGTALGAGSLKACYIKTETSGDRVLYPTQPATIVDLESTCPRDLIRKLLYERLVP